MGLTRWAFGYGPDSVRSRLSVDVHRLVRRPRSGRAATRPGRPLAFYLNAFERKGSSVEVKIGVTDSPRELIFNSAQTPSEVEKAVTDALGKDSGVLTLTDEKGRRFLVQTAKIAYVEIGAADVRRVGFGVGSHFTYSVLGLLGYRFQMFGRAAIAHAGYRALSQNYATRTDGDLFKWDMILHGPILGLTIRF